MKKSVLLLCLLLAVFFGAVIGAAPLVLAEGLPQSFLSEISDDVVPPEEHAHEGIVSLEGKTIMIVGNSMVYYGNCVVLGDTGKADYGYFYQLAAANDNNVTVIDHTYPGEKLNYIYDTYLTKLSKEERNKVDYLVLSEGNQHNDDLVGTCEKILALFREDVEFRFLRQPMMFESDMPDLIRGVKELREKGYQVVDWGKLVYDIHSGTTAVPGATMEFNRASFMKENKGYKNGKGDTVGSGNSGDRNHQNPLSGYITAQMLYTSLTNRSAVLTDYSFCFDNTIHPYFNIDTFAKLHYTGTIKTNFNSIFRSPQDMLGLQMLMDQYLQAEGFHPLTVQRGVAPTCSSGGLTHGSYCAHCQVTVEAQEVIPANDTEHQLEYITGKLPTCTEAGTTSGVYCRVCGQVFQQATAIPCAGHTTKTQSARATAKADGYKKTTCTTCGETLEHVIYKQIAGATLSQTDFIYNGTEQKPTVTVTDVDGNLLKEGTDYTLVYSSGRVEVKNYKVTVTYAGNYSGTEELVYQIRADKVTDLAATGYLKTVKLTWTPAPKATHYRIDRYDAATDTYKKVANTTATSYKVTGLKSGTEYTFRIRAYTVAGDRTYYSNDYAYVTTGTRPDRVVATVTSKKAGAASVTWDECRADGYEVTYSVYKSFALVNKVRVTDGKICTATIPNLTSGKRYYVKVRAYKLINGQKIYGYYSKIKNVTIK